MTKRKIDRRTRYTINGIKEAFLELINQHSYSQITVAQVCRQAEITRSTFYLHFNNLTDVLNSVLDDALMISQNNAGSLPLTNNISIDYLKQNESLLPTCQRIANSQKYRALLMDPDLSEYIIGRIANHERASTISLIHKLKQCFFASFNSTSLFICSTYTAHLFHLTFKFLGHRYSISTLSVYQYAVTNTIFVLCMGNKISAI